MRKIAVFSSCLFLLSGCYLTEVEVVSHLWKRTYSGGGQCANAKPHLKVGNAYKIKGVTYRPMKSSYGYREEGIASWYGADFHEKLTANGECYDMYAMTAAHKTLPLPTTVRVTNLENGRSVVVRVNDRGPYAKGRIIDLSYAVARKLGMAEQGVAPVRVEAISGPHHQPGGADTRVVQNSQKKAARATATRVTPPPTQQRSTGLTDRVAASSVPVEQKPVAQAGSFTQRIAQKEAVQPTIEPAAPKLTQGVRTADYAVPAAEVRDLPPPPTQIPTTSAQPLTGGVKLFVQTGAFSNKHNAMEQLSEVRRYTKSSFIVEVEKAGRTLHRVRSGPYISVAEADVMLAKLVDAGFNTAVIAVDK